MCGIFGYITKKPLNDKAILNSLQRRGPDAQGKIRFSIRGSSEELCCTLLHTRLSIIDLSASANQPMVDSSKKYAVVYDGEIYNYRELKEELRQFGYNIRTQSDTEVLLMGYIQWGEAIIAKLRGMFAFCIYDELQQKLFIARDHFGIKPLYYYQRGNTFCFSSTIAAIFASGLQTDFTLDKDAIRYYLGFGSFIAPDTILKEVKSLLPGHYLIYCAGDIKKTNYYRLEQQITNGSHNEKDIKQKLRNLMFDSVERHLIADVPVGIFLSGGIDSSLVAGIASKVSKERIHTYTVGFEDDIGGNDETEVATKTAKFLNSVHENIILKKQDFATFLNEFLDAIDVPTVDGMNTYFVAKAIGSDVKVVLSGLGGDEMFAGYPVFHQIYALQHLTKIDKIMSKFPVKVLNHLRKGYLKYIGYPLFDILMDKRVIGNLESERRDQLRKYLVENANPLKAVSIFEISNYMANMLLRDTDAITLHYSLECRVPFVDKEVFAFVMSIADKYKIKSGLNKALLVHTFPDLLIRETYKLPKRGFTLPIVSWMQNYLTDNKIKKFQQIATECSIYPDESPFKANGQYFKFHKNENYYQWMILLKWIEKNIDNLNLPVR